jgi:gliding motility-associated-like protein
VIPNGGTPSYTYQWSGVGSQTTQTASAFTAGTYTVTVSDANHCTVQGVVIIPDPNPVGVIPLSTPDTICIGQMAQITAAGFGGTPGYTYQWSPSLGTTGGPFTVNPVTTTGYTVYAVDANGCLSPQQSISVYVNPALTVSATDVTMCSGSSVNISATATGGTGGPYTYNWSNGVSGDSQTVSPTVGSSPMNYIVTVDDGCSFPAFDTATVIVHPLAVSFMTVNDTAGCEDFTVQFTGLSDIGTQYTWDFGDGSGSQTGTPVTHTYATPGQYDVTLTVMTAMGCYSTITTNSFIDVYATPVAEFSFSPNEIYSTNPVVTFTNQSLGGETYAWDFIHQYPYSGMYGDTLENTSFSYPDTGVYNVQLIVFNSFGCSDTVEHQLDIIPEYVLYAPNAFTPTNHDGINDMFMPKGLGIDPNNFQMSIYDRWGNRIFQTTDVNKGWDGRANGGKNIAQIDTYVWKIDTQDFRGNKHEYIGHVTIVK